ncbi:MAG TPA: DUF523 and DUF1722 domain-containing protein [Anaeromyxobacteraceae bacterium]|nr:DUF523 and DUF1722 domain-containing protein [Anaeromyxobacteraceae bacterium]
MARPPREELRIGISSCLLGHEVRYDGGHKRNALVMGVLSRFMTFVPVCPEVELGMPVPRPAIRLIRGAGEVRLIDPRHGVDHTAAMTRWAEARVRELEELDLSGYLLKKGSPSCGMERVKVYAATGPAARDGVGVFARALRARMPLLPVEEEGRLEDPGLRERFVTRVFAYRRLRALFGPRWRLGDLVRFHASEKLLLLAHEPRAYAALGRLVAGAKALPRAEVAARYGEGFMAALEVRATPGKNANVLQHMAGYFKDRLDAGEKAELQETIQDHRRGLVPLIVPLTLLRHHLRRHGAPWLEGQTFLDPHPKELMLRNHV